MIHLKAIINYDMFADSMLSKRKMATIQCIVDQWEVLKTNPNYSI